MARYPSGGGAQTLVHIYLLGFAVLPLGLCLGVIHVLTCILSNRVARRSILIGLLTGFLGVVALHVLISLSDDGAASMGYIMAIVWFSFFTILGFVISSVVKCRRRER